MSKTLKNLCLTAMLSAVFVLLDFLTIPIGNSYEVSLAGLPVIICAIFLNPLWGMATATVGSFIGQIIRFGLGPTTLIWMAPEIFRALIVGILFILAGKRLSAKYLIPIVIFSSVCVTGLNILATYLDGLIWGYSVAVVFVNVVIKICLCSVTAVAFALVIPPVVKALKKIV